MSIEKKSETKSENYSIREKFLGIFRLDIIQELLLATLGAIGFLVLYSFFPEWCWNELYRAIICAIIVFSFFIAFIIFNQPNPKINLFKVNFNRNIILFSLFNFAILSFLFFNTNFAYSGLSDDNFYRFAFVTQMANSGHPQDFAYRGRSAFMAPLYWYLLALFAIVFNIEPYIMVKYGFLFAYYILPICLYEVWKILLNKKKAFFITALFFTFVANFEEIIWIDHLIGYMFFVPFFLYYFENLKNKEFNIKDFLIAGVLGSVLVCTFYLYFILIPIYLMICLIQNLIQNNYNKFKIKLKRVCYISIFIIIFSSWFWVLLILDITMYGSESHQNNFLPKYALDMPFEAYVDFNLFSVILILGVVFILLGYSKSNLLTALGNIVISVFILYYLGYIGLLIGFPLVHYRVLVVSYYVLVTSFVLFYFEFFRVLKEGDVLKQFKQKVNLQRVETIILILIIFYQNYENTVDLYKSDYYNAALIEQIPDEVDIVKEIDGYKNKVFLTNHYEVAAFLPIYLFITHNAHFSHPSALNNERVDFLEDLSECDTTHEFHDKLEDNEFGKIHYFYLTLTNNGTEYFFDAAEYEVYPERDDVTIYFNVILFEHPRYFEKIIIDNEIIIKVNY